MKAPKRRKTKETVGTLGTYRFEVELDDIIAMLKELKAKYEGAEIRLSFQQGYYDSHHFDINVYRPETDKELEERLQQEAARQTAIELAERLQYQRLKAKYEDKPNATRH